MKYGVAIFDLDGTLLDTLDDLKNALNYALKSNGFPVRTRDDVRRFVGNGMKRLIKLGAGESATEKQLEHLYQFHTSYYSKHNTDETAPYDGIVELLKKLKAAGVHLAVVSNKDDYAVGPLCEKYFPGMFEVAVGVRDGVAKKPAPDTVFEVLKKFGGASAVYIGDSEVDIETAKNANLDCISVTWGFRDESDLIKNGATAVAHNSDELLELL